MFNKIDKAALIDKAVTRMWIEYLINQELSIHVK